ncbi:MAG: DNA polymerase I [Sandaracinaceae bacterium]
MATTLPAPGDPDVLWVVDLTGYVFRAYHALPPMSTASGEPTHAVYGVTQMLLALVNEQRPARLAVALDSAGPSFRKELYPEYKATRPPPPEDLREQIDRLEDVIEAYAIPCLINDTYEADDLIATMVRRARDAGLRVVVVSADKDLLQLVQDGVVMFDTMRNKVFGREETVEKMGVPPEKLRDYLALVGDSSDNVPGVKSVGPKTASKLLADYEDLDDLYAHLDDITKKALKRNLTERKNEAYLSQKLVTLDEHVPIEFDLDQLRYGGADEERLRALFTKLEFHKLLSRIAPRPKKPASFDTLDAAGLEAACAAIREAGKLAMFTLAEGDDALNAPIVGVGLSWEKGQAVYAPIGHLRLGADPQIPMDAVTEALKPLLEDPSLPKSLGDSKRERLLWRRHGVDLAGVVFDVMLASYVVDPERHTHALEDVARTELDATFTTYEALTEKRRGFQRALSDVDVEPARDYAGQRADLVRSVERILEPRLEGQGLRPLLDDIELPLARVLARMEQVGVRIDAAYLRRLSGEASARIAELETQAEKLAGRPFKITSPRELETILFDEIGLEPIKRTKTARSTDHEVLEALSSQHDLPKVILEHRLLSKLQGTYLDALPKQIHPETGRVHTRFNQAVAATGRMSSSDPNLQNIPIRTEEGRKIRDAFIAREGWQLLSADYSQIELRVLAHLSEDVELIAAFTDDVDVHVRTASAIFGVPEVEIERAQREAAKTVNYAVIYGQSAWALARNLGIEQDEAQRYIDAFYARYEGVAAFMEDVVEQAKRTGGVRTLFGRWRTLADIRSRNFRLRSAAERMARNTPIQGTAADLIKVAMVRIDRGLASMESRMLLTVHDELVFEVAPGEEDALMTLVKDGMERAMELKVPLVATAGLGRSWNDAH